MNWLQLIIAIAGSGAVTAFITGLFNVIGNKQNNKYNQDRFEKENEQKKKIENTNKEKESANDLLKIIKPAIETNILREYIKYPEKFSCGFIENLYIYLTNNECSYKPINEWIRSGKFQLPNQKKVTGIDLIDYIYVLIKKDMEKLSGLNEFMLRYNKSDSDYDIDIEQLNKDIDIINETLNMHIKKF